VSPASSRNTSSSSTVFDVSEAGAPYTSASTLAMAEEIDRTANQLKRRRERAAAAALGASRFDPPERDQTSPLSTRSHPNVSLSSSTHISCSQRDTDHVDSHSGAHLGDKHTLSTQAVDSHAAFMGEAGSDHGDDHAAIGDGEWSGGGGGDGAGGEDKEMSVRERVALLNQRTPKRGDLSNGRASPLNHSLLNSHVSPRSQSDTGVGSDTDTDSELRHQIHPRHGHAGETTPSRPDRSRLSLPLIGSSRSSSPALSSESSGQ
jgi:hypothetical protein